MFSKFFIRPSDLRDGALAVPGAGRAGGHAHFAHCCATRTSRRPSSNVRAIYPGASAEVLETTVAAPIEQSINGVEKMLYMSSSSSGDGAVSIDITFEVGTNLDIAAVNVNNRVNQVLNKLAARGATPGPDRVQKLGQFHDRGGDLFA